MDGNLNGGIVEAGAYFVGINFCDDRGAGFDEQISQDA